MQQSGEHNDENSFARRSREGTAQNPTIHRQRREPNQESQDARPIPQDLQSIDNKQTRTKSSMQPLPLKKPNPQLKWNMQETWKTSPQKGKNRFSVPKNSGTKYYRFKLKQTGNEQKCCWSC
jgi:hypothetical protein